MRTWQRHGFVQLQLLTKKPKHRLGCQSSGGRDVQSHPFFKKINFRMLELGLVEPSFKPDVSTGRPAWTVSLSLRLDWFCWGGQMMFKWTCLTPSFCTVCCDSYLWSPGTCTAATCWTSMSFPHWEESLWTRRTKTSTPNSTQAAFPSPGKTRYCHKDLLLYSEQNLSSPPLL